MNILATEFSLNHKALEVYLAGCKGPHCPGCHNPETWAFDQGVPALAPTTLADVGRKVQTFPHLIDVIWVLGGEPLDQDHKALEELLDFLRGLRPVWLFTSRELDEVPPSILARVSAVKTGRYDQEKTASDYAVEGVLLGSTNQRIHLTGN